MPFEGFGHYNGLCLDVTVANAKGFHVALGDAAFTSWTEVLVKIGKSGFSSVARVPCLRVDL